MYLTSPAGVLLRGSAPSSIRRWPTSALAIALTMWALTLSTIAGGVFAGKNMPYQVTTSNPGTPDSIIVGISGITFERCAVEIASALILPALTSGTTAGMLLNFICTLPAMISVSAAAAPLYGT